MPRILVFALILVALLAGAFFLPLGEWITALFAWVDENRTFFWAVFIVIYIVATVLLLPGSLLTLGAGFLFGPVYGYFIVAIASVTGASCAFLVGRFFARDWVESKLSNMPRFSALDAAVAERGGLIVLLTRLSPVFPFNLLNYALGLTNVNFSTYALVSWLGMIPGTLLYVYLGSAASDITSILSGEATDSALSGGLFYVGLGATLILTIVVTRIATRTLNQQLSQQQAQVSAPGEQQVLESTSRGEGE